MRVSVQITTKDRATEVAVLLQSLRTQSFQDFDIILLDDASGTNLFSFYFINSLLNRLRLENHRVKCMRNDFSQGVCAARQKLIDSDDFGNKLILRLDDDCIIEPDYISKLVKVIASGYDIATGVVPLIHAPEVKRETKFVEPIICKHIVNEDGVLVEAKDELWSCYLEEKILPVHQFRTNALFKREVFEKIKYPINLSRVGFREEGFISLNALMHGFKIGCNTKAVAYHFACPSGGVRDNEYAFKVQSDDQLFREWIKKNKDKLREVLQ